MEGCEPKELRDALDLFRRIVPGFPPRWPYWRAMARIDVRDAVWLTMGFDPKAAVSTLSELNTPHESGLAFAAMHYEADEGELQQAGAWLESEFTDRHNVLMNRINAGWLDRTIIEGGGPFGESDRYEIYLPDVIAVAIEFGWYLPAELRPTPSQPAADVFFTEPVADGRWPWGSHETELLRQLEAAARRYWVNYDPADPTTAPTNADVQAFLMGRGVGDRAAEIMAQMLRADGLKPGPRPGGRTPKK